MSEIIAINKYNKKFISRRIKKKEELNKWINSTFLILVTLIIFLFIYYLWTLNANATMWYSIRNLEKEIYQLKSKKDIIETKIANLKSLDNISKDKSANEEMENIWWDFQSMVINENIQYAYNN